jgi:hypothetical protein
LSVKIGDPLIKERWNSYGNDPNKNSFSILPFKKLPNVRKFRVEISDYDDLFKKHGIKKRLPPRFTFEKYANERHNRYMVKQLKRMSHLDERAY